jgi:hypothetical protein
VENHITAKVDIEATLLCRKTVAGSGRRRGREERAAAYEDVTLLGGSKVAREKDRENWCK